MLTALTTLTLAELVTLAQDVEHYPTIARYATMELERRQFRAVFPFGA
jgi:hypothetical protein